MQPSVKAKAVGDEIMALTGLRGVAALYVVVFHYLSLYGSSDTKGFGWQFLGHGYLSVDLFFVLSGFVMAANYGKMFSAKWTAKAYCNFLGRRIARVYPLYIFTAFLGLILIFLKLSLPPATPLPIAIISQILLIQEWGISSSFVFPAWSMSAEWAAYLVFPVLAYFCLFQRWAVAVLSTLLSIAVIIGLFLYSLHGHSDPMLINRPVGVWKPFAGLAVYHCIAEFSFGLVVYRIYKTPQGAAISRNRWLCAAVSVLILALLGKWGAEVPVILLFPVLVLCLTCKDQPMAKVFATWPMEWLGRLSYSIYLFHLLVALTCMEWIDRLCGRFGLPHQQTISFLACIVITFVVSLIAYKFLELPARLWLRNVFEPNRKSHLEVDGAIVLQQAN